MNDRTEGEIRAYYEGVREGLRLMAELVLEAEWAETHHWKIDRLWENEEKRVREQEFGKLQLARPA